MIRYALRCRDGHGFESWFQSGAAFDALREAGHLTCPVCGVSVVVKVPMAPPVRGGDVVARGQSTGTASRPEHSEPPAQRHGVLSAHRDSPAARKIDRLRRAVEASSEDVGRSFAAEARAIHEGAAPDRAIRGEATADQARALLNDGIPVLPLPFRDPKRRTDLMAIIITGANRGIGRGLYDHYAGLATATGHEVIGTARNGAAPFRRLDVTKSGDIAAFAAFMEPMAADLLVCNSGVYPDKGLALADTTADHFAQAFAVNVTGVLATVQALYPALKRAAAPKVAIIASNMGVSSRASGDSYAYRASKAGAINLGRNLAADLASQDIAVGVYHPGWVRTDMGGTGASLSVSQSVAGLTERFAALGRDTTGCFEAWDGTPLDF